MKELIDLFLTFARVGGLTFGGGYAMLPMLQQEVVGKRHWATEEEIMDYYALGQCTPGIIAVNVATFIGYKIAGLILAKNDSTMIKNANIADNAAFKSKPHQSAEKISVGKLFISASSKLDSTH